MATPADLEDFAIGFSLAEGLIARAGDIESLEVAPSDLGVEVRMWLANAPAEALAARRRRLAGPVGCGLCGIESLEEAIRASPRVSEGLVVTPGDIHAATQSLGDSQPLGAVTRATHAAGWWSRSGGLWGAREDVGRHNALDKLAGARARAGDAPDDGILVLTSRVSVEMVQKAAVMGAQVIAAISAPTDLAVRTAQSCGLTLAAVVRDDGFEVLTAPNRIAS